MRARKIESAHGSSPNKVGPGTRAYTRLSRWYETGRDPPFTQRELDIMRLLADGLNKQEVARQMFISHWTVSHHVKNLNEKTNIHTIAGLVAYMFRRGLLE